MSTLKEKQKLANRRFWSKRGGGWAKPSRALRPGEAERNSEWFHRPAYATMTYCKDKKEKDA